MHRNSQQRRKKKPDWMGHRSHSESNSPGSTVGYHRIMPTLPEFRNEPFTDFSKPENRQAMREALALVRSKFGREYPLWIAGEQAKTGDLLRSVNPSNPSQ